MSTPPAEPPRTPHQGRRLLIEMGPLLVFFLVYTKLGIYWATGVFMVAIVCSLAVSWVLERRLPRMLLTSAVLVLLFGGLTLVLHEEEYIKIKVTATYLLFAFFLLGGLLLRRMPLQWLLESTLPLTPAGWRALTAAWIVFFLLLAVVNEIIRQLFTTDLWVKFKVFGVLGLTVVFSLCLAPIVSRHLIEE